MDISEFSYLWTEKKDEYVLVNSEYGYSIVNVKNHSILLISDDELNDAVVDKMLSEGILR